MPLSLIFEKIVPLMVKICHILTNFALIEVILKHTESE